jgi:hypothetical protein
MGFFLLDPQGPPSWARLSPFLLPLVLLSPRKLVSGQKGNAGTSCAGAWMGQLVSTMPYWWSETMITWEYMGFFLLDPQGPPSWARLSPFLLPLVLLSPLDASRGFMFPSYGMPRSTPTLRW